MTSPVNLGPAHLMRCIFKALQPIPGEAEPPRVGIADETSARPTAPVVSGDSWCGQLLTPATEGLSAGQRQTLAAAWRADALQAHAAVATMARFTQQLLALGAPPELVRATHRASLDHVTHAEMCFALASAYRGQAMSAGPLDPLPIETNRRTVLRAAIREGCVGATVHAMALMAAAADCRDEEVLRVLQRIAADQVRHAGHGWRFVRWAIRGRDDHDDVRDAFARATASCGDDVAVPAEPEGWLRAHGRLPGTVRREIALRCASTVIVPCVEALLGDARTFPHAARLMQS